MLLPAYSWKEFGPRDGGNFLKHRRRIILWIIYVVGLVLLAIWASWRHKQEVAHRLEDSYCRQLPDAKPTVPETSRNRRLELPVSPRPQESSLVAGFTDHFSRMT
jgi:hypothetical protein